jgi:hypothetical protein
MGGSASTGNIDKTIFNVRAQRARVQRARADPLPFHPDPYRVASHFPPTLFFR